MNAHTYGGINQPMTKEQIEEQEAFNRSAQFHNKSMALGHQPTAQQMQRELEADAKPWPMSEEAKRIHGQIENFDKAAKGQQAFDSEAHRRFMRSLG